MAARRGSRQPLPSTDAFQYQAGITLGHDAEPGLATMHAILERRAARSDIRLHQPTWSSLWRANVRLAEHYRDGRVLLAGDAAHIHSPAGGQGMNTGIQDAHNLAWKLVAVCGGASPTLLDSYETERRPVAAGVLALSDARLRDTLDSKGFTTRRDSDTTQLGVNYRGSGLVSDDRDDPALLRAGDRAPDATDLVTVDGEHRLFDLIGGGRFTLLDFGVPAAAGFCRPELETLRVVEEPSAPNEVADSAGHLARAYGATDRTLVLIRPDGYVGLISDANDLSAVSNHLAVSRPVSTSRPLG